MARWMLSFGMFSRLQVAIKARRRGLFSGSGKKSYAVNFILQDESRTLIDKAIDAIMQKLMKNLTTKLHAELR